MEYKCFPIHSHLFISALKPSLCPIFHKRNIVLFHVFIITYKWGLWETTNAWFEAWVQFFCCRQLMFLLETVLYVWKSSELVFLNLFVIWIHKFIFTINKLLLTFNVILMFYTVLMIFIRIIITNHECMAVLYKEINLVIVLCLMYTLCT